MDIYKTPIVPASQNVWWQTLPQNAADLKEAKVLVLALTEPGRDHKIGIEKIIKACKLEADEANIVFVNAEDKLAWSRLKSAANPALVLLLGIAPSQLGIQSQLPTNMLTNFDKRSWIITASPGVFFTDTALRGHVWNNCLRPYFNIAS